MLPAAGADFSEVLFVEAQPPEAQAIVAEQSRLVRFSLCPSPLHDPHSLSLVIHTSRKNGWPRHKEQRWTLF